MVFLFTGNDRIKKLAAFSAAIGGHRMQKTLPYRALISIATASTWIFHPPLFEPSKKILLPHSWLHRTDSTQFPSQTSDSSSRILIISTPFTVLLSVIFLYLFTIFKSSVTCILKY